MHLPQKRKTRNKMAKNYIITCKENGKEKAKEQKNLRKRVE